MGKELLVRGWGDGCLIWVCHGIVAFRERGGGTLLERLLGVWHAWVAHVLSVRRWGVR